MFLEHVNMSVKDIERSIEFYQGALGFEPRWRGRNSDGGPAVHIGNAVNYIALIQADGESGQAPREWERAGLNHFGWVVKDLDAAKQRLADLGVKPHFEADYEPGRRLYFFDPDGIEVELVEYPQ